MRDDSPEADTDQAQPALAVEDVAVTAHDSTLSAEAEIARLAALSSLDYKRERVAIATTLGMRPAILDKLVVAAQRHQMALGERGRALALPSPEPWPESVDGAILLTEMTLAIQRYVVVEHGAAETVALWVLHAHTLDAFSISPRLAISSPEKQCGKTTLLDVIARLVPCPLPTSNTTTAAVFRSIEAACPTRLIDEADTFLHGKDDLRGILNSGLSVRNASGRRRLSAEHILHLGGYGDRLDRPTTLDAGGSLPDRAHATPATR